MVQLHPLYWMISANVFSWTSCNSEALASWLRNKPDEVKPTVISTLHFLASIPRFYHSIITIALLWSYNHLNLYFCIRQIAFVGFISSLALGYPLIGL